MDRRPYLGRDLGETSMGICVLGHVLCWPSGNYHTHRLLHSEVLLQAIRLNRETVTQCGEHRRPRDIRGINSLAMPDVHNDSFISGPQKFAAFHDRSS